MLCAVTLHMAGVGLTLGVLFPLTSLTLESWGAADWTIGLAGAMSPVAILLLMPVLPPVVARLGAVRAMAAGCALAALAIGTMYALQSVPAWIAARFAIGAGLALPWLAGDVWINAAAPERLRGRVIGAYIVCFLSGLATGPVLLRAIGIGGFAPHALCVGALLLATVPLAAVRRRAPAIEAPAGSSVLGPMRAVPLVAVGAVAAGFAESAAFALLPVWGLQAELAEAGALRLLSLFVAGGIAMQLVVGVVADRVGRAALLGLTGLGLCLAAAALELVAGDLVFALAFACGGASLAIYSLSLTILGERFAPRELANASAAYLVLYQLGSMTGPVVAGTAMATVGGAGFAATLALAGLACAGAALRGGAVRGVGSAAS